jgi:hypothetical protein
MKDSVVMVESCPPVAVIVLVPLRILRRASAALTPRQYAGPVSFLISPTGAQ